MSRLFARCRSLLLVHGLAWTSYALCRDDSLQDCLKLLSQHGLAALGTTKELVETCGDENPPLLFLSNHDWLPDGRVRETLEARFPSTDKSLNTMGKAFAIAQNYSKVVWLLAVDYAHTCISGGVCMHDKEARTQLRQAHAHYMSEMADLLKELTVSSAKASWVPGLGEPTHIIAGSAFRHNHMEFTTNVVTGFGVMEAGPTISVLHDLSTRLASSGCQMLAQLLGHFTLTNLPLPSVLPISDAGFPRFEFHSGSCCRRYHVLGDILGSLGTGHLKVAEVGVNNALTSEYLLSRYPDMTLHGVDPWIGADHIRAEAEGRFARFGERARLLHAKSKDAAQEFAPHSFDLVFIDGDHSREAVLADLRMWRPLVKPGGVLAGHDLFNPAFEGVLDALLEHLRPEANLREPPTIHFGSDFMWWIQL